MTLCNLSLASYEHTQIMIATSREKYFFYGQLDPPTPQKNSHMNIQALTICTQSTYLTNLKKKKHL
jgi:hypothetical protein